jgi:hypothetical protein
MAVRPTEVAFPFHFRWLAGKGGDDGVGNKLAFFVGRQAQSNEEL